MRGYTVLNLVAACFLLYILLLPVISPVMKNLFPDLWRCQYKALTGNDCPVCGITGDIGLMLGGNFSSDQRANPLSLTVLAAILLELVFRILTLLSARRSRRWVVSDIVTHSVLLAGFVFLFAGSF